MCNCLGAIVKFILFIFNFIIIIGAIALVGLGTFLLVFVNNIVNEILASATQGQTEQIPSFISAVPTSIIILGCVIFVIGFAGCCGACVENRCMLVMYAIFMGILAVGKAWLAGVILSTIRSISEQVERWIVRNFDSHVQNPTGFFLGIERALRCCGAFGEESYLPPSPNFPAIPGTCCSNPLSIPDTSATFCNPGTVDNPTYDGCSQTIIDLIETFGTPVASVVIFIVIVEVVAIVFALYLTFNITRKLSSKTGNATRK